MNSEFLEPALTKHIIKDVAANWGLSNPEFVRWFDNIVYRVTRGDAVFFLRLTPSTRRSKPQIESELAVLYFLDSCGISVNFPITSTTGEAVMEFATLEHSLLACVFSECPGHSFQQHPPANIEEFFRAVGRTMGGLHRTLQTFVRPNHFTRLPWREDRWNLFSQVIPPIEVEAWTLYYELRPWWDSLEVSSAFGLIHGDFTVKNFRYDGTRISLFDFDGTCEHWYGYELACFFHHFANLPEQQRQLVQQHTLAGYNDELAVTTALLEQLPQFGQIKLLRSFLVCALQWGFTDLTADQSAFFAFRRQQFRAISSLASD